MAAIQGRRKKNTIRTSKIGKSIVLLSGDKIRREVSNTFLKKHYLRKLSLEESLHNLVSQPELMEKLKGKVIITSTAYIDKRQGLYSVRKDGDLVELVPDDPERTLNYGSHGNGLISIYVNEDDAMESKGRRFEVIRSSAPMYECETDKKTKYQSVILATKSNGKTNLRSILR